MRIALVGPELEENLGLRYMAASLESAGHSAAIVPFATEYNIPEVVRQVLVGMSQPCEQPLMGPWHTL